MSNSPNKNTLGSRHGLRILIAAILLQALFASVYWQLIYNRAGFETLWWIVGGSGLILAVRLMQCAKENIHFEMSTTGAIFLVCAFLCNASLVLFADPWLLAAGFLFFLVSLECSVRTKNERRAMAGVALPLTALLLPLLSLDIQINDWISKASHYFSEQILRVPGILIANEEIPFRFNDELRLLPLDFSIQPSLGVPFMAAIGLTLIGLNSRRLFHSALLMSTVGFWAVFAQSTYLISLGVCFQLLLIDVTTEIQSTLAIFVALVTIGLVISTDQFLAFWLGPVTEESLESTSDLVNQTGELWNRWLATRIETTTAQKRRRQSSVSGKFVIATAVTAILLGGFGFIRFLNIETSTSVRLPSLMDAKDLVLEPESELIRFETWQRNSTSDLGSRQYRWHAYLDGFQCLYSVHELDGRWANPASEQINRHWKISKQVTGEDVVNIEMEKESGEKGLLIIKELGHNQRLTSDPLGNFPTWNSPAVADMFLTHRVYLKIFSQYFKQPSDVQLQQMQAKLEPLEALILD